MKKFFISVAVCILLLLSVNAHAQNINVQIPTFYTEIDYVSVDNRYVEYPLIVYKDITYFPMTYDLCQSLGLMAGFTSEEGLYITNQYTENYAEYERKPYGNASVNEYGRNYPAVIPDYPIYLNGKRIYNDKEEYPLVNFRGVTYFPMTYRFAYEELGFDVKWSNEEWSFKVKKRGGPNSLYPTIATDKGVEFIEHVDVYAPHYDEKGEESGGTLLYSYNKSYLFDMVNKSLSVQEFTDKTATNGKMYEIVPTTPAVEMKAEIKDNAVYADGIKLLQFGENDSIAIPTAYKTDIGNNTSIVKLYVDLNDAPAPYTQRKNFVIEVKDGKARQLDFDSLYNLGVILDMGDKVYVEASGYCAAGSSRWANSFSDVFVYDKNDGSFNSLTEQNKDKFNSIQLLGYTSGKLYVKAMWLDSDKSRTNNGALPPFSTVVSGFYSVDLTLGHKMTKLYPYIKGETFVFPDGNLYCVASYSLRPMLVNLCTGEAYKFD